MRRNLASLATVFVFCLFALATSRPQSRPASESTSERPKSEGFSTPSDEKAMKEIAQSAWVKDLYVSPGFLNVGVFREEKDWSSPMIGTWVCGFLRRNGSNLRKVRFVDIRQVVGEGKSPREAEIAVQACS